MLAVLDQQLLDRSDRGDRADQKGDPGIVKPPPGNRDDEVTKCCPEPHRCSGDAAPPEHAGERSPSPERSSFARCEANCLPEVITERLPIMVDDRSVTEDQAHLRRRRKFLFQPGKFVRPPDVVLVGEDNQVAAAETDGVLEVRRRAEILGVLRQVDGKRGGTGKRPHEFDRVVDRSVVANDQLVRPTGLLCDALELLGEEPSPVEGTHRDREHLLRHDGVASREVVADRLSQPTLRLVTVRSQASPE